MPNTTKDAAVALPDWPDTDPSNGEIARDNVAHQPVSAPSPEVEPKAQDDTADDADDVERLSPNSSPPSYSKTTEPVADSTAENDGAEGGDAGTETDGVEDDGGAGDDDDDLDFEPWDELDDAAAQHKEDWRRATQPRSAPVDGEELFAALVECFHRFMILPPGAAEVLALWVVSTYALHACNMRFAVRVMITAPGANSGKTTLLDLLCNLVRHPDPTSDLTPASFFRSLHAKKCVLIDECDHNLPSRASTRNQLVQMINMGHKRTSAVVQRVETVKTPAGSAKVTRRYAVFAPIAMAGIGSFAPPTIRTRSFEIRLMRKMAHEQIDDFIPDEHAPKTRELRSQILRWVIDNKEAIRECRSQLDRDLFNNRQRDNATMLLQIADCIGPHCGADAREAIKKLTRRDTLDPHEMLLGDIASILTDPDVTVGDPPRPIGTDNCVFSGDLCDLICLYYPHRETYQGFTQARLASMLSRFDIAPEPRGKRRGKDVLRWYRRNAFDEWLTRYGFIDAAAGPMGTTTDPAKDIAKAATPLQPEVLDQKPLAPGTGLFSYRKARVMEPAKGDKKRGDRLRQAVDGMVFHGLVEPDAVEFISTRFWVIHQNRRQWFVHLKGETVESCPIGEAGLVAENGVVQVNPDTSLRLADSDFMMVRRLVNAYRKTADSPA